MNPVRVHLEPHHITVTHDDLRSVLPLGLAHLSAAITADPPAPEELTNAIGAVLDHLEDAGREVPALEFADRIDVCGGLVDIVAAVEVGVAVALPFELSREAAEDVFRTLATERRVERAANPGLPAHAVHDVLGSVIAVVSVMRFSGSESVWLVAE
jgi:exopolyphosphatase/guanosine-5'-triphosphate,3'-diphosphate pyrophosphatase